MSVVLSVDFAGVVDPADVEMADVEMADLPSNANFAVGCGGRGGIGGAASQDRPNHPPVRSWGAGAEAGKSRWPCRLRGQCECTKKSDNETAARRRAGLIGSSYYHDVFLSIIYLRDDVT